MARCGFAVLTGPQLPVLRPFRMLSALVIGSMVPLYML